MTGRVHNHDIDPSCREVEVATGVWRGECVSDQPVLDPHRGRVAHRTLLLEIAVATGLDATSEQAHMAEGVMWNLGYRPRNYRD